MLDNYCIGKREWKYNLNPIIQYISFVLLLIYFLEGND